ESKHWEALLKARMKGLIKSNMWTQAHPKDRKVVGTKTVLNRKVDADEEVERYKCKLVAQGFRQVEGLD
ncbi:unnamed protein product, partial [Discosporangium mesarthrocarpum]